MRTTCRLFAVALVLGLTSMARADIDFQMTVLDGPITGAFITDTTPFQVDFGNCPTSLTNGGALGCFTGVNDTGGYITSIDLTFDNTVSASDPTDYYDYLNGQTPDCAPSTFFTNATSPCYLNGAPTDPNATYILDFAGGPGIPPTTTFYIAEYDASPNAFVGGMGTVTISDTPEPSSILLLSTGIVLFGLFFARNRRTALGVSPF